MQLAGTGGYYDNMTLEEQHRIIPSLCDLGFHVIKWVQKEWVRNSIAPWT